MTLLVISPDYASHLYPLATLATAWQAEGERVVVATGAATDAVVRAFGYDREHLQLGRGSNPGVIRAEEQPPGEDEIAQTGQLQHEKTGHHTPAGGPAPKKFM